MSDVTYDLSEIIDFKGSIPDGSYIVRLKDVQLGETRKGSPKMDAIFEIQEGEYAGDEMTKPYYLTTFTTKKGTKGNRGLSEFRQEAGKIGATLSTTRFTASDLRKEYAKAFGKKKLVLVKSRDVDKSGELNEDGTPKTWPRYSITGLAAPVQQVSSVSSDPLSELGF